LSFRIRLSPSIQLGSKLRNCAFLTRLCASPSLSARCRHAY
jgi:hypothetical protein